MTGYETTRLTATKDFAAAKRAIAEALAQGDSTDSIRITGEVLPDGEILWMVVSSRMVADFVTTAFFPGDKVVLWPRGLEGPLPGVYEVAWAAVADPGLLPLRDEQGRLSAARPEMIVLKSKADRLQSDK